MLLSVVQIIAALYYTSQSLLQPLDAPSRFIPLLHQQLNLTPAAPFFLSSPFPLVVWPTNVLFSLTFVSRKPAILRPQQVSAMNHDRRLAERAFVWYSIHGLASLAFGQSRTEFRSVQKCEKSFAIASPAASSRLMRSFNPNTKATASAISSVPNRS
jgi:hypothetical protein